MRIAMVILFISALFILFEPLSARQVGTSELIADTTGVICSNVLKLTAISGKLSKTLPLVSSSNAVIVNAATKDNNGNGFIDAINITFDQDTSVLSPATTGFSVKFGNVVLPVIVIERTPGGTARQWRLLIGEPTGAALATAALQTSWTPTLTLTDLARINSGTVTCIDSCAPVIYRVIKVVTDLENRANDTFKVMFSEKISSANNSTFAITTPPPNTFAVWWGNTTVSADTLLNGINNFISIVNDSILYFIMNNNKDLTAQNWMNIETSSIVIRDNIGNTPASNNRKVPVELQTILIIKIYPNPAVTVATEIQITHDENISIEVVKPGDKSMAKQIVLEEKRGGMIIAFEGINIPPLSTGKVLLMMEVYDASSSSHVIWARNEDLFKTSNIPGTSVYLYWNGFNQNGMKVVPGIYYVSVYIDYSPASGIRDISYENASVLFISNSIQTSNHYQCWHNKIKTEIGYYCLNGRLVAKVPTGLSIIKSGNVARRKMFIENRELKVQTSKF
jgi:hypothetical protein